MKFERKYYIYILISLILSITAIADEQTISSELANFTEINTSRIFREYDASTSEILLSSDALYLNHVNGGINEVKITSTDTQFMNDIDMAGNNINNCGNCGGSDNLSWQNSKMNKSNETMIGYLNMNNSIIYNTKEYNGSYLNFTVNRSYTGTANPITEFSQTSSVIKFRVTGNDLTGGYNFRVNAKGDETQDDIAKSGWAVVMKPYDGSTESRFQVWRTPPGNGASQSLFEIRSNLTVLLPHTTSVLQIINLSGSGYAFACLDADGKLIRSLISCDLI